MDGGEVFIPIITVLSIVTMIVFLRKFTNEERMAMIDKGTPTDFFKNYRGGNFALKFGLLLIGAGFGLLIGAFLDQVLNVEEPIAYFSMLFMFGGLGLFASHMLERKQREKDAENN